MFPIAGEDLLERLDHARAKAPDGVLAFDADGTLWVGDVGDDFFEALLSNGDVLAETETAMAAELARQNIECADGIRASRAVFEAYHGGKFDEERFYEVVAWAAAGRDRGEIAAYADRVQSERGLGDRLHAEVRPVLDWARERRVEVYVVSASPRIVVQRGVRRLGIDAENVFGAQACFDGERMLPDAVRPIPYGPGKVTALRSRIAARPILGAFGDNVFDIPMLKESAVPVVVRPKPRLINRFTEVASFYRLEAPM